MTTLTETLEIISTMLFVTFCHVVGGIALIAMITIPYYFFG